MKHAYDLERFVSAQAPVYETALSELRAGGKKSHWMWYIFPQIAGLGISATAQFYAIGDRGEATAYLSHPLLGPRLVECTKAALAHADKGAPALFGAPDDLKFQSSITLFSRVHNAHPVFKQALEAFFGGIGDEKTLKTLRMAFIESLDD